MQKISTPTIENRKAKHEYFIERTVECGIELRGNEVKSIRAGKVSIKESWVDTSKGELIVKQMHITPWETANQFDVEAKRDIRLLAHKSEIRKLHTEVKLDGKTVIPLKIYFNERGRCKMLIGLCKGKHNYDKRQTEKERSIKREMARY